MSLTSRMFNYLAEPPKRVRPFFRYVLLLFAVVLLVADIRFRMNLSPELRGGYGIDVGIVSLLANVLAFQLDGPVAARVVLRSLATILTALYLSYGVYWWHALHR